jgi:thiol-disulfide isomerase/thioredoxin
MQGAGGSAGSDSAAASGTPSNAGSGAPTGTAIQVGQNFDLSGPTIQGYSFDLKTLRGKPVAVVFWASWCHFCQDEMPDIQKIYQAYHADGFQVVGVSLDNNRAELVDYARAHAIPWPQLFIDRDGQRGWQSPLATAHGIQTIPSVLLIDAEGRVAQKDLNGQTLEIAAAKMLGRPSAGVVSAKVVGAGAVSAATTRPVESATPAAAPMAVGDSPSIEGPTLGGNSINLEQLRGKPVLVEFWASWCHFCQAEMPAVSQAYDRYHPKGLEVVGVSLDNKQSELADFVGQKHLEWPQIFDATSGAVGWNNPLAQRFHVVSIPYLVLLDRNGKVIAANLRGDGIEAAVASALGNQ